VTSSLNSLNMRQHFCAGRYFTSVNCSRISVILLYNITLVKLNIHLQDSASQVEVILKHLGACADPNGCSGKETTSSSGCSGGCSGRETTTTPGCSSSDPTGCREESGASGTTGKGGHVLCQGPQCGGMVRVLKKVY
jgi:hypothetical protein